MSDVAETRTKRIAVIPVILTAMTCLPAHWYVCLHSQASVLNTSSLTVLCGLPLCRERMHFGGGQEQMRRKDQGDTDQGDHEDHEQRDLAGTWRTLRGSN